MQFRRSLSLGLLTVIGGAFALGCSSDSSGSKGTPAANGGGSNDGGLDGSSGGDSGGAGNDGGGSGGAANAVDAGHCDVTLAPSKDDVTTIQTALDTKVKSGNTVCFSPGTYKLQSNHIALSAAQNVTFKGTGAKRDDVLFDFTGQVAGEEGVLVSTDGFTIENLSIKNTAGNGIKVQANDVVFRNIKVYWDKSVGAGPDAGPLSGAYAIYPVNATNVLMENNEVYGAADAGIYAGQCTHVIARGNDSHDNVLGIEIENTQGAEVYGNNVHGNVDGLLLDLLPKLAHKDSSDYLVHDNKVIDNNLPNFAQKNTLAAIMPQGTGILVLAAHHIELTKNDIEDNDGVPIIIVNYGIIDVLAALNGGTAEPPDPLTPRIPHDIYVHENTYKNNGTNPQGSYALLVPKNDAGMQVNPYDVLWDGVVATTGDGGDGGSDADAHLCLGTPEKTSFVNFKGGDPTTLVDPTTWTTDATAHLCTSPVIPPLTP